MIADADDAAAQAEMKEILSPASAKRAMSTEGMGSLETLLEKIEEKRRSSLTPAEAKDEDAAASEAKRRLRKSSDRTRSSSHMDLGSSPPARQPARPRPLPLGMDDPGALAAMGLKLRAKKVVEKLKRSAATYGDDFGAYPRPPWADRDDPVLSLDGSDGNGHGAHEAYRNDHVEFVDPMSPGASRRQIRRTPESERRAAFRKAAAAASRPLEAAIDDDDVDAKMLHLDRLLGAVLSVAKVEMGVDRCCFYKYSGSDLIYAWDAASRRDVVGDAAIDDGDRASAWSESIVREAASDWETIRIDDVYDSDECPPPLADDLATGYRTKTILAVPVAVDRVASTGLACDDEPWTKLGVLLFTNKFFNHSKEDGEGEVLHVAGRASDQGERRTTRIVEVGVFNDFDCARARGLVDAVSCAARVVADDALAKREPKPAPAAEKPNRWLEAFTKLKQERAARGTRHSYSNILSEEPPTPPPGSDVRQSRKKRHSYSGPARGSSRRGSY